MNLAHFPFDIQMCTVEIGDRVIFRMCSLKILSPQESFGYTMADLKYAWNSGHNSVQMSPDVSLPQFSILGHRQRLIEVSNISLCSKQVQLVLRRLISVPVTNYLDFHSIGNDKPCICITFQKIIHVNNGND